jgi:septum formation protein
VISLELPLLLGSASPRRRELLAGLGLPIRVVPGDANEDVLPGELHERYLERVVEEKLCAVAGRAEPPFSAILVADTIVVLGDEILGKPADEREAAELVGRIVGRTHVVHTRYAISRADNPGRSIVARTVQSRVSMRAASDSEVARYARTGEGLDKAGGYAAQGIGAFLVERIEGSYSNVIGLPVCEVVLDLQAAGLLASFP